MKLSVNKGCLHQIVADVRKNISLDSLEIMEKDNKNMGVFMVVTYISPVCL